MPANLLHVSQPVVAMAHSQALSPARLIFLISLVAFFTVLFVVAYVWMRSPGFGQRGGHQRPRVTPRSAFPEGRSSPDSHAGSREVTVPTIDSPVER
jgi:hypothetical protein